MGDILSDYRAAKRHAVATAKRTLAPGDRVSRHICSGRKGTFTFTHFEGNSALGRTVECHPADIYAVNGSQVQWFFFDGDFQEVLKLLREERLSDREKGLQPIPF